MRDPGEGVSPDGLIVTGARRDRVPQVFEPVLSYVVGHVGPEVSVYVYGSVATGVAEAGRSDVDVLTVGLPVGEARAVAEEASALFADVCRGVEIAPAFGGELDGPSDKAYGNRAFLRHYCVHLAGPDPASGLPSVRADARAARGFNGDIGRHLARWRAELPRRAPAELARAVARKTLLAVAGLVSVQDRTWTTDRAAAARRWSEVEPELSGALSRLVAWTADTAGASRADVDDMLAPDGPVERLVTRFERDIGLWSEG